MTLMDKLRAELIDIVEWVDDSEHTLVWRFPRYHNQIKNGAQLIVRPGQQAVMVSQGKVADVFGPGQYRLETKNLPILSTLLGWKYGFESPFKAEVYFVSTRQITDLKWGTPNPVIMRDADFGPVRVRGFGTYTLRAIDARILLSELVGTDHDFEADEVTELLRSAINMAFADVVANSGIAVMDLATRYPELSESLREAVVQRIDDEFGLEIPQLYIVNISLPAEVEKAVDARSGMGILGDMARYQAYQIGRAIPDAAQNPAGGIAGAGIGLGMGMAMAGPMMQGAMGGGAPPATPPPPPTPVTWHVAENGQAVGPFSIEQLGQAVGTGRLQAASLVWTAGMTGWTPAGQVPQLIQLFQTGPPPVPGQ
ncbi:MAG: SPFH domain-containing protein [Deltaproteobacteria bacterium]|jgi:membrane protease subunit (stomatin/prohibitin family)|nr:SPFH domain-containing protein [Deltaproteobacteria bacterium]MBW2384165.1 SPFH domain-containing protein [Deltaproteobacteria bacterium]